jgi:heme oxygenase
MVATQKYVQHMEKLDNRLVAAHVYVHYMGEMFGGQVLKKRIPHDNTTHMDIEKKTEAVAWIRELIHDRHDELKNEANTAFDLMMAIHNEIFTCTTATI